MTPSGPRTGSPPDANPRWVVADDEAGHRLDRFLAIPSRLGSRGRVRRALERRKVLLNGADLGVTDGGRPLRAGDVVHVWVDRPGSARARAGRSDPAGESLSIVFEDGALIVVNKPAGLLSVPLPRRDQAESVAALLTAHLRSKGKRRPLVVHRIDRDTSGLVVFATTTLAQARLKAQFRRHEPRRVYLAVVYGVPTPSAGVWTDYLAWDSESLIQKATRESDPRASLARSEYRVVETFGQASLLEVRLHTGKRNQIRLQARLRGHTLVGEQRYVYGGDDLRPISFSRQALHASGLSFNHPATGLLVEFEAPLPADMRGLIDHLRQAHLHASQSNPRKSDKLGTVRPSGSSKPAARS